MDVKATASSTAIGWWPMVMNDDALYLQQYLRCYMEPDRKRKSGKASPTHAKVDPPSRRAATPEEVAIKEIGFPYEGWCLVLDCETTTDTRQVLRVGAYAVHGISRDMRLHVYLEGRLTRELLDTPRERGFFYDPAELSAAEIATLTQYAQRHGTRVYERAKFIKEVFYFWVYTCQALCIGHNLPFDLSRLATSWGDANDNFYGGFWLKLCDCEHEGGCAFHPPLRIKTLGSKKVMMQFRALSTPNSKRKARKNGRFLDTLTFGRALLGPGDPSLEGMGKRFRAGTRKRAWAGKHGGPITPDYLDYLVNDVAATWDLYRAEREVFKRHHVSVSPWQVYSEASLGKAYFKDMGVPPFLKQHPEFPKEVIGHCMSAYYGGRSEVRIRLKPTEVIYADFKSQYPTVNALMDLQSLLLAERMEVRRCPEEVKAFLDGLTLAQLQGKETWRRLRCIVKVIPEEDILPCRANYGDRSAAANIGVNVVTSPIPTWYALADVIASWLLTGKAPHIVDAIELVPHGRVVTTHWRLFGDERYSIDLATDDLFTRVIELRSEVKATMKTLDPHNEEFQHLDGLQLALKLLANSTSYGVLVEIIVDERADPQPATLYADKVKRIKACNVEKPGRYFAGPVGTLIPAAGRLLLAIAERLGADRGIGYVLCDTDSMAFARPEHMDREAFRAHVRDMVDWFSPLSPYREGGALLELEELNDWEGAPCPLHCLAVSAKRYAVYNRLPDGSFRIRKFSSHGTGELVNPPEYVADTPKPHTSVYELGGARWTYDLWYEAISQAEHGNARLGVGKPAFDIPARMRATITTAHLLRQYKEIPGIRPFSFITVLPGLTSFEIGMRRMKAGGRRVIGGVEQADLYSELEGVTFYARYSDPFDDIKDRIRRADTHEVVNIEHKTLNERLRGYFMHREHKSYPPEGVGLLERRPVQVLEHIYIGKETREVKEETAEETGGVIGYEDTTEFSRTGLSETLKTCDIPALNCKTGIPKRTLYDIRAGAEPSTRIRERLLVTLRR